MDEMDLRVAALEMLVWELLAMLPHDLRRSLHETASSETRGEEAQGSIQSRIMAFRNQILRSKLDAGPQLDQLIAQVRLRPDND